MSTLIRSSEHSAEHYERGGGVHFLSSVDHAGNEIRPARIAILENDSFAKYTLARWLKKDPRYAVVDLNSLPPKTESDMLEKHPELLLVGLPSKRLNQDHLMTSIKKWVDLGLIVMILADKIDNQERSLLFESGIATYCVKRVNIDTLSELIDINVERKRKAPREGRSDAIYHSDKWQKV